MTYEEARSEVNKFQIERGMSHWIDAFMRLQRTSTQTPEQQEACAVINQELGQFTCE